MVWTRTLASLLLSIAAVAVASHEAETVEPRSNFATPQVIMPHELQAQSHFSTDGLAENATEQHEIALFANALVLASMLDDVPGSVDDLDMLNTLADARSAAIATNATFLYTPTMIHKLDAHAFAVYRPPLLAFLTDQSDAEWRVFGAHAAGDVLIDVLSCTVVRADEDGSVHTSAHRGMPMLLMPASIALEHSVGCGPVAPVVAVSTTEGIASVGSRVTVGIGWMSVAMLVPVLVAYVL
ncbi:glycoside hydrolase family 13 protein [Peniophora sp. CONT]|nr:glycoside hydrolase family 13 protein [Peniophora sp. CONT]